MTIDSIGFLEVVGVVQNNGTLTSTFTKIIGIFYSSQNNITFVGFTFTSPDSIPSGARYGFKLIVSDKTQSSLSTRVTLLAESDQYSGIPEFPWPAIALTTVLSVGIVAMRKRSKSRSRPGPRGE
jgi:hypothetical protein